MSLNQIFEKMIEFGTIIRKIKTNNIDTVYSNIGKDGWTKMTELLTTFNGEELLCDSWNTPRLCNKELITDKNIIYDFVHNDLNMKGDDEDDKQHILWESSHFFLQLARIPKKYKCSLVRICQLGYNIGQLLVGVSRYEKNSLEYYIINSLNKIESYINPNLCTSINSIDITELLRSIDTIINDFSQYLKSEINQLGGSNISKINNHIDTYHKFVGFSGILNKVSNNPYVLSLIKSNENIHNGGKSFKEGSLESNNYKSSKHLDTYNDFISFSGKLGKINKNKSNILNFSEKYINIK